MTRDDFYNLCESCERPAADLWDCAECQKHACEECLSFGSERDLCENCALAREEQNTPPETGTHVAPAEAGRNEGT